MGQLFVDHPSICESVFMFALMLRMGFGGICVGNVVMLLLGVGNENGYGGKEEICLKPSFVFYSTMTYVVRLICLECGSYGDNCSLKVISVAVVSKIVLAGETWAEWMKRWKGGRLLARSA